MARRVYHWKHGWIPLTHAAALQKAHGSEAGAAKLMGKSIAAVPAASLRRMSDDDLATHLGDVGDNEVALGKIMRELDRRDREQERRTARKQERESARDAEFERQVDAGVDAEAAYAAVYGVSEERQRRQEAISSLRAAGYRGAGLDALVRDAFKEHVRQAYLDAETVTRGQMRSKEGRAANIDERSLFVGPEARARKYASRELLDYWQQHGRMTVEDFKASVMGGQMRSSGTAAWS